MQGFSFFSVKVPDGMEPGQSFVAMCGNSTVSVVIPPGATAGSLVQVQVPTAMQYQPPAIAQAISQSPYAQQAMPTAYAAPSPGHVPTAPGYPAPPASLPFGFGGQHATQGARPARSAGSGSGSESDDEPRERGRGPPSDHGKQSIGLCGLCCSFRVSACALICGLLLVLAGKTVQEVARQRETATLWEVRRARASRGRASAAEQRGGVGLRAAERRGPCAELPPRAALARRSRPGPRRPPARRRTRPPALLLRAARLRSRAAACPSRAAAT